MAPRLDSPKIDVFNPRRLSDQQVEAVATGREDLIAEVIETIERNAAGGTVQHLALVAPRGYGKSFLLRQLRRRVEDLAARGVPVAYAHLPEELPNVSTVARLLEEVRRFMVGDLTGGIGHFRDEAPDALPKALAALEQALDEGFGPGRGLVVAAVENFDSLLEKFARKAARAARRRDGGATGGGTGRAGPRTRKGDLTVELALRGVLERPGNRLMLLISATRNIRNDQPGHPLFQWILEHPLEPWSTHEVLTYALRRRRLAAGPQALLAPREQTRLAALARFTSGAPRMIAVLVDHLLGQDLDQAALNLSALIDELTPYYKHRIDDLGDEAQEVFDALLRGGEPASQSDVAARFAEQGLTQGAIAESFRRLQAERLVEGRREAGGRRRAILYRATDRVMAYWYKQRQVIGHDPAKRGISHFEEAVELLAAWYSRDELCGEAAGFARAGRREEAAFLLHLSRHGGESLLGPGEGPGGRQGPRRHLRFGFVRELGLMLRLLGPEERQAGQPFLDRLASAASDDLAADLDAEARAASGRWRVFLLCTLSAAHLLRGADREREDERAEAAVTEALGVAEALRDGDLAIFAQSWSVTADDWGVDREAAVRRAEAMDPESARAPEARLTALRNRSWAALHKQDYARSEEDARAALEIARSLDLPAVEGRCLCRQSFALHGLGRTEEALESARQAVAAAHGGRDQRGEAEAWNLMGWLLSALDRNPESLEASERAAELAVAVEDFDTASSASWRQSANLNALQRHEEALAAARKALEFARTACSQVRETAALERIGYALRELDRHDEAITALMEAAARRGQQGDREARANDLRSVLHQGWRMGADADFQASGLKVLDAFVQLAEIDPDASLYVDDALRVAAALGNYEALTEGLRRTAANGGEGTGWPLMLAIELDRIADTVGRARAYAAMAAVLDALMPDPSEPAATPEAPAALIRALTLRLSDPGLLRDLADYLEGRDATAQGAQIAALRARATEIESGGDQAAVERIDPDLSRFLESRARIGPLPTRLPRPDDADLALWPCAVAPAGRAHLAGLPLGPATPETIAAFDALAPGLGISNLDEFESRSLLTAALSFLPGGLLLLLPHRGSGIGIPFVLYAGALFLAGRNNQWLYRLVTDHPLDLSATIEAGNALCAYLRLFSHLVAGPGREMRLVERPEEVPWLPAATDADRERAAALVEPMVRLDNAGERAVLRTTWIGDGVIDRALIAIPSNGIPEMTQDETLAEGLPIASGPALGLIVAA